MYSLLYFFFQAEDGIRDRNVTGVQTCALPIFCKSRLSFTTICFTILIHPGQFHKCFSFFIIRTIRYTIFPGSKHYTVDWNGRRRLLENTNRFSSCEVMLPKLSLSCGNSKRSSVEGTIVPCY